MRPFGTTPAAPVTNNTPPAFASAAVVGDALTVTFNGALDPNSRPAADAFTVTVGGTEVELAATNPVAISGSAVTLTLAESVGGSLPAVTVGYAKPAANPLRDEDAAKLPVAGFTGKTVTNNTSGDTTPPSVSSAAINGRTLTLTFNEALDESSVPTLVQFPATIGGQSAGADSIRVAGKVVTLTYPSVAWARHGHAVTMDYRNFRATHTPLRDLSNNAVAEFIGRSVTNNTPPAFASAAVVGDALTVTFNGALDPNSRPAADAFTVTVGGTEVELAATNPVAISGSAVTLTLAESVGGSLPAVTVGYAKPAANPLRDEDAAKLPVAGFTGKTVANNTSGDTTPPTLASAAIDGATMTLTFSEALDPNSVPPNTRMGTKVGTRLVAAVSIRIAGRVATVTLPPNAAAVHGQTVTVTYGKPTGAGVKRLRDLSANEVETFENQPVANNTARAEPVFASASANGTVLTVHFDRALDGTRVPAKAAFTVTVDGDAVAVADGGVAVGGSAVTLTLASAVAHGQAVTVGYDRSQAGSAATLRDAGGNEAQSFAGEDVDNRTPAPAATIASVAIESAPSIDADGDGAPETYGRGEQIGVRVTWSADVLWDLSAAGAGMSVGLDVGGTARSARLLRGGEPRGRARSLLFGYTVAPEDRDADGIVIARTVAHDVVALAAGATLKDALGRDAVRGGTGEFGPAPGHKVDGDRRAPDKAPELVGASVSGKTLTLTFDEDLAAPADPEAASMALRFAFFVQGGRYQGAPVVDQSPSRVAIGGPTVTLTLGSGVGAGQPVTVSYQTEGIALRHRLKDAAGKEVEDLEGVAVDNATGRAGPAPVLARATVEGSTLTLFFDRGLDSDSRPAGRRFEVRGDGPTGARFEIPGTGEARVNGARVVVTLAEALPTVENDEGETIGTEDAWMRYFADNETSPLRGADGARVADIDPWFLPVLDGTGPAVRDATISGTQVTLYYDEALDELHVPAPAAFAVTLPGGEKRAVQSVAVRGTAVFLTLAAGNPLAGLIVRVGYTASAAGAAGLRDMAGNEAGNHNVIISTDKHLGSAPEGKPALAETNPAEARGDELTLNFDRALDATTVPGNEAFTLSVDAFGGVVAVTVHGTAVELRLGSAVQPCDGITVRADGSYVKNEDIRLSYAQPAHNALRDHWGTKADGFDRQVVDNRNADPENCETDPFAGGYIGSIVLVGRRPFAQDAPPRAAWFTVKASGGPVAVTGAAFSPDDPYELKLTLDRDFAPDETATVSYRRPLGARGLWNVDGRQLADVVDLPVTMRARDAAPSVEAVAVVSDPGADATYAAGDAVRARATFGVPVTVDTAQGTPRLKLDLGGEAGSGERWADYEGGTGTKALAFVYTVAPGDASAGGVAVLADTLEANGGTLRSAAGADAALAHAGLDADPAHKVDADPPGFASAAVDGAALAVTFDEDLDADSAPAASAFAVTAAPAGGEARAIAGSGAARVAGATVTVTLAEAVAHGETLTLAYAPPEENPVRDVAGNAAAAFSGESAENGTGAPAPSVEAVAVVSDPGADATYAAGDAVRARVTFAGAVAVDTAQGTPRLKLDLGGEAGAGERWAVYEGGGGTKALAFAYAVAAGDVSTAGVAVVGNSLEANGGTIRSQATGADAELAHAGVAADPKHKVDGQLAPATPSAPAFDDDSAAFSLDENHADGAAVGTVAATDADGDAPAYWLSGADAEPFGIGADGTISVKSGATLDFEAKARYAFTAEVSDGEDADGHAEETATADDTIAVTVEVGNVEEPPEAPTGVTVAAASATELSVSWTAPADTGALEVAGYEVRWFAGAAEPADASGWTEAGDVGAGTSATLADLAADTAYRVQVRARRRSGPVVGERRRSDGGGGGGGERRARVRRRRRRRAVDR